MRNVLVVFFALLCAGHAAAEEVHIYVSLDRQHSERLLRQFEKESGIKVVATFDTEANKTVGLVNRLISEKGDPQADVYWNNELATTIKLKARGVLQPYQSPGAAGIPAEFKDPEGYWVGFGARARVLIVNTDLVKPDQVPTSMWDLTLPQWKGKVCMARPETGTTAAHAAALYVLDEKKADEYFDKLVENDVVWLTGNAHCMRDVSAGRFAFGWTDTDDFNVARLKGAPVSLVYPDAGAGPDRGDVHPEFARDDQGLPAQEPGAAQTLIDWLLRPEIEKALCSESATAQIPVRPGVPGAASM